MSRTVTLTRYYMRTYAIPRGYDTTCPICGRSLGPGDRVHITNNKNGNKYFCESCFYSEPVNIDNSEDSLMVVGDIG